MNRLINATLVLIGMYVWMYRKYGITAMLTKKLAKHAAVGRAKRRAFWNTPVRDHRGLTYSASSLIAQLRAERAQNSWVLAA